MAWGEDAVEQYEKDQPSTVRVPEPYPEHYLIANGIRYDVPQTLDHICCCDPGIALCGEAVAGTPFSLELPASAPHMCPDCAALDRAGVKCLDPGCPGLQG
jgi:hypothetical protein